MPVWIASLISMIVAAIAKALLFIAGYMLFKLLLLMGFSYVIYKGMDIFITHYYAQIKSLFSFLPEFVLTSLSILQFDVYISIIISAMILRFTLNVASRMTFFSGTG